MNSTGGPCAACKYLRQRCPPNCIYAPYFPREDPKKWETVHSIYGATRVHKILKELPVCEREDTIKSLVYEAEYRLRDPVYGCVGLISKMNHHVNHVKKELEVARKDLFNYIWERALYPIGNVEMNVAHQLQQLQQLQKLHQMQQVQLMQKTHQLMAAQAAVSGGGEPNLLLAHEVQQRYFVARKKLQQHQQREYLEAQQQYAVSWLQSTRGHVNEAGQGQNQRLNSTGFEASGLNLNHMNSGNVMQNHLALGNYQNSDYQNLAQDRQRLQLQQQQRDYQERQHSQLQQQQRDEQEHQQLVQRAHEIRLQPQLQDVQERQRLLYQQLQQDGQQHQHSQLQQQQRHDQGHQHSQLQRQQRDEQEHQRLVQWAYEIQLQQQLMVTQERQEGQEHQHSQYQQQQQNGQEHHYSQYQTQQRNGQQKLLHSQYQTQQQKVQEHHHSHYQTQQQYVEEPYWSQEDLQILKQLSGDNFDLQKDPSLNRIPSTQEEQQQGEISEDPYSGTDTGGN